MAQLTAERDALRARVAELEQTGDPDAMTSRREEPQAYELRQELARALERAQAAEERAARLEADLLAERQGVREIDEGADLEHEPDGGPEPIPTFRAMVPSQDDGNAISAQNGGEQEGDKSLRFRLAQSAARKKGLGELEPPPS